MRRNRVFVIGLLAAGVDVYKRQPMMKLTAV